MHRFKLKYLLLFLTIILFPACGGGVVGGGSSNGPSGSPSNNPGTNGPGGSGGSSSNPNNTNTSNPVEAAICGDGECNHGETFSFCPADCPITAQCDNDGQCERPSGEHAISCPADCSMVGGFPNIQRNAGDYISGPHAQQQGRTAILAYHGKTLITIPEMPASSPNSDYFMRTWNIADPANPQLLWPLNTGASIETTHPVNAHGYMQFENQLNIGWVPDPSSPTWQPYPNAPNSAHNHMAFVSNGNSIQLGRWTASNTSYGHGNIYPPWAITTYSTYHPPHPMTTLRRDNTLLYTWDHVGLTGIVGHPFILGDLLIYASDDADLGVVTYSLSETENVSPNCVSTPAAPCAQRPKRLDTLRTGNIGGYEPEIWSHYMVFPKRPSGDIPGRMQMVDFSDPADLKITCDIELPHGDIPYVQFQDEFGFINAHKIDMRTCTIVETLDVTNMVPNLATPNPTDLIDNRLVDCSQMTLPIGNIVACGGLGCRDEPGNLCTTPRQGLSFFAHQSAPDIRGPSVSYHLPRDGQTNYPITHAISILIHETLRTETIIGGQSVILRNAATGVGVPNRAYFTHNDVMSVYPVNAQGAHVSLAPNTTYEVIVRSSIEDVAGNPMDGDYAFRFSTGNTITGGNAAPAVQNISTASNGGAPSAPGDTVILTVSATDAEGTPLQYQFDFGDGSNNTGWLTINSAGHVYSTPGHYTVEVRVRDADGRVTLETFTVTVTDSPGANANQSSQLICNDGQNRAWTVNPDDNSLTVIDVSAESVLAEVPLTGDDPRSIAQDSSDNIWVTLHDSDQIAVINPNNLGAAPAYISTGYGTAPYAIVMDPSRDYAYVSLFGSGQVLRINTSTRTFGAADFLNLGPTPRALALTPTGNRLLVTRFISGPNFGEVWSVNTANWTAQGVSSIQLLKDLNPDSPNSGIGVPNYLADVLVSNDGNTAWVTAKKDNVDRGSLTDSGALDPDNTVRAILATVNLQTGAEDMDRRIDIDNSDSPSGMALSPYGDYLFMAMQGNNITLLFDVFGVTGQSGSSALLTRLTLDDSLTDADGRAPQDVCVDPESRTLVTKNLTGRSVSIADLDPLLGAGRFNLSVHELPVVSQVNRVMAQNVMLGKQVFYNASDLRMSSEGYISCASCHIDGTHDGRTWDFTGRGEGLRNTIPLQGRSGTGHGDVHWTANFDEIQDFEHDIRNAFGGTGFLSDSEFASTNIPLGNPKEGMDADLDAMAAYLGSLDESSIPRSPFRDPNRAWNSSASAPGLTASAAIGRDRFQALGCVDCHIPGDYTDGDRHDVGTLRNDSSGDLAAIRAGGGIDTPTLLGLHDTAPYGHDGSFPTLTTFLGGSGGTVYQAEDFSADPTTNPLARDGSYASVPNAASLTMTGINGGTGGRGQVRFRYNALNATDRITVTVNGNTAQAIQITLQPVPRHPNALTWRENAETWLESDPVNVTLLAGNSNTIQLRASVTTGLTGEARRILLDTVTVSTPADMTASDVHRAGATDTDLREFLLQLDGRPF